MVKSKLPSWGGWTAFSKMDHKVFFKSFYLQDTVDWGTKCLVDFSAEKTQLVLFDQSDNTGVIDVKIMGLFLRKNHRIRCWSCISRLNWIWALTLSPLLKLPPRKSEPWFVLWSFFLLGLLCISINMPFSFAWNTVVMSELLFLAATRNC